MIFIDSWVLIEFFSEGTEFEKAKNTIERMIRSENVVISAMVIAELKYRIAKKYSIKKSDEAIYKIQGLPNVKILPITTDVAILAADLRIKYYDKENRPVSYADMINLATAVMMKCDRFYSGDPDFKDMEEIKTVVL
jgi:predicted nucleic acid-binding protein